MAPRQYSNLRVAAPCIVAAGIMLGLVAYSPTLYQLFCAATGFWRHNAKSVFGFDRGFLANDYR